MPSFKIGIKPSRRAAAQYVGSVRRAFQRALVEEGEKANGIKQADIARAIGVNRSVINRELRGHKDITLGRVGELAWALNRKAQFSLAEVSGDPERNVSQSPIGKITTSSASTNDPKPPVVDVVTRVTASFL